MLNEWKEFQDYTCVVNYTVRNKQDTTYLGRFTFDTILGFEGLNRVLTILARGFLFHNEDGSPAEMPRDRIDYAKRGLCAWCSVPDSKNPRPGRRGSLAVILGNFIRNSPALWMKTAADGFIGMCIGWQPLCRKNRRGCPAVPRRSVPPLKRL